MHNLHNYLFKNNILLDIYSTNFFFFFNVSFSLLTQLSISVSIEFLLISLGHYAAYLLETITSN